MKNTPATSPYPNQHDLLLSVESLEQRVEPVVLSVPTAGLPGVSQSSQTLGNLAGRLRTLLEHEMVLHISLLSKDELTEGCSDYWPTSAARVEVLEQIDLLIGSSLEIGHEPPVETAIDKLLLWTEEVLKAVEGEFPRTPRSPLQTSVLAATFLAVLASMSVGIAVALGAIKLSPISSTQYPTLEIGARVSTAMAMLGVVLFALIPATVPRRSIGSRPTRLRPTERQQAHIASRLVTIFFLLSIAAALLFWILFTISIEVKAPVVQ